MPGPASNKGGGVPLPVPPIAKSSGGSTGGGTSSYSSSQPKNKSSSSSGGGGSSAYSSSQPKSRTGSGIKILWIPGRKKHQEKGVYKPTNYNIEHKHGERKNEPWSFGGSKSQEDIISSGEKDDKVDLIKSSTPTPTATTLSLPTASLGVATVNIDDCSESDSEIKLEKKDLDSIERLDDLDGQPKLSYQNGFKPTSKCKKTKEDKAVKCLYYTMMCCECTIS